MKKIILIIIAVIASFQLQAQNADAVIAQYLKAIGGLENIKKVQTVKATGNFQQGGMNIPFVMTQKRPNKMLIEVTFQGMTQKICYDGSMGWIINPFQGRTNAEKMDADGTKEQKFQADIDGPLVDYAAKGNKVEYIGEEDMDGSPAVHLKLTTTEGDVHDYYFDKDAYLLVKEKAHIKTQDGSVQDAETNYSDYKDVNGLLIAFTIENVSEDQGQSYSSFLKMDKLEQNVSVDDAIFKMPATDPAVPVTK